MFGGGIRTIIILFVVFQMFLADDYELQGLCQGHCPFCRKNIDFVIITIHNYTTQNFMIIATKKCSQMIGLFDGHNKNDVMIMEI